MTTATDFASAFGSRGLPVWEASVGANLLSWPFFPVTFSDGVHTCLCQVASDYLTVGELADYVRMPLTPRVAQALLNGLGAQLPTPLMVSVIHQQAPWKVAPHPMVPNQGANMSQYVAHSRAIDAQLAAIGGSPQTAIVSGHKKDVVVSNIYQPGKVLIFGWYGTDNRPIQGRSNVHGDFYVDYSHGIRPVLSTCILDGIPTSLTSVLQGPLASLLSDEGPLRVPRYPAPNAPPPTPVAAAKNTPQGADLGLAVVRQRTELLGYEKKQL